MLEAYKISPDFVARILLATVEVTRGHQQGMAADTVDSSAAGRG
jgi:hypothetical protein